MRNWISRVGLTLLTTVSAGAFAAPASAATTGVAKVLNATEISFKAGSGKTNQVVITRSGRTVTIDDRVTVKAGTGCKAVRGDKTKVRCTTRNSPADIDVRLGDGNDTFSNKTGITTHVDGGSGKDKLTGGTGVDWLKGAGGDDRLDGRTGNDAIYGGTGNDVLHGGSGNDGISGNQGNDRLTGASGDDSLLGDNVGWDTRVIGDDVILGGPGQDSVKYSGPLNVRVDLDGASRDDGRRGEHDTVGADIEKISGGDGDDVLIGNSAANDLYGGEGNDRILGGAGNDILDGGIGEDVVLGQSGNDTLYGWDAYTPESQVDRLDGGTNATTVGDLCNVGDIDVHTGCERGKL